MQMGGAAAATMNQLRVDVDDDDVDMMENAVNIAGTHAMGAGGSCNLHASAGAGSGGELACVEPASTTSGPESTVVMYTGCSRAFADTDDLDQHLFQHPGRPYIYYISGCG